MKALQRRNGIISYGDIETKKIIDVVGTIESDLRFIQCDGVAGLGLDGCRICAHLYVYTVK
jgi:hypothetical protein